MGSLTAERPVSREEETRAARKAARVEKRDGKNRSRAARRLRRRQRLSPLTRKILAVNLLALLIPVVGMLYLGPYRESLIAQEIDALREQGEIFSGALGEGAIGLLDNGQEVLNIVPARDLVRRLSAASEVRARFFLADGSLAVDSRQLGSTGQQILVEELDDPIAEDPIQPVVNPVLSWLDSLSHWIENRDYPLYRDHLNPTVTDYPESVRALQGESAFAVRRDDNRNLVLTVALPVQRYVHVFGSLMLSRDGGRIDEAMRDVRLTILAVFAGALVITTLVSLYFASTIARPLHRLAEAAEKVRHSVGRDPDTIPDLTGRRDEIGDLSAVLREMTSALTMRITAIERFAADVSHEIKNPLTSLKSAIETVQRVKDPNHQRELLRIVKEDVERLDRLITDISDASRLDAELGRVQTEEIDLADMLEMLVGMHRTARGDDVPDAGGLGPVVRFVRSGDGPFRVGGMESRLVQIFQNLIGNAESFSPRDGTITVTIAREGAWIVATCEDDGPGIPAAKLEEIFNRFYTERPQHEKFGAHSGLGLSICKQIAEAHGGAIHAENRPGPDGKPKGARFVVRLPAV
ncbi:stimulus-sensing domain-containing protein [Pacificispira sp.]|uniref:stimulus-sensing domain-containing protein n=1 Tax=Pacificispira sp. TaxID=2888761 RepID=UPI003B51A1E6